MARTSDRYASLSAMELRSAIGPAQVSYKEKRGCALFLDKTHPHGIIEAQKGAAHGGQPLVQVKMMLTAREPAGRSTSFSAQETFWASNTMIQKTRMKLIRNRRTLAQRPFPIGSTPFREWLTAFVCTASFCQGFTPVPLTRMA